MEYGLRPVPAGAVPRMTPPGNVGCWSWSPSVARAESAKRKAQDEEVSSGDSGTPSFMEELMGTVGGEIVVPEVRLFRSRYDLSDEYRPCFLVPAVGLRWRKH